MISRLRHGVDRAIELKSNKKGFVFVPVTRSIAFSSLNIILLKIHVAC